MTQTEHDNKQHDTIIVDADPHFSIDIKTRAITNAESKKTSLIQYDHNSERFSFDIDRYIEGHDILLCNRVQVHYINVVGTSRTKHVGMYDVTDLAVHPTNDKKACFTWLISENATHYDGTLNFLVSFACVKDDEVLYRWNSGICTTIVIVPGINNSGAIVENYPDILLQMENEFRDTTIPDLVDLCYVEREFATSSEVAEIFGLEVVSMTFASSSEVAAIFGLTSDVTHATTVFIVQKTGQSTEYVMSQKAVTDAIASAITTTLNTGV